MEGLKDCDNVIVTHYDNFEEPCKFLSKDFDLVNYQFIKNRLKQNTGFLVVGVIGKQSVGKSFILNMLANNRDMNPSNNIPFQTANINDMINRSQKTTGIDIHVTSDRVFLLDAQSVLSLGQLGVSMEKEKKIKVYSNEDIDSEGKLKMAMSPDILAVKLMSYFLSVCHVVIVVDQQLLNYRLLKLIDLAHRLRPWIPCNPTHLPLDEPKHNMIHSELHDEFHDYVAQVMFVDNMSADGVLSVDRESQYTACIENAMVGYNSRIVEQNSLRTWLNEMRIRDRINYNRKLKQKKLQQQREKLLNDSSSVLQLEVAKSEGGSESEGLSLEEGGDTPETVEIIDDIHEGSDRDKENMLHTSIQRPVKLLRVPLLCSRDAKFAAESESLQRAVFSCPRKHFCVTQNERFTELCWLEYASEMWQATYESQMIVDFFHSYANIVSNDI